MIDIEQKKIKNKNKNTPTRTQNESHKKHIQMKDLFSLVRFKLERRLLNLTFLQGILNFFLSLPSLITPSRLLQVYPNLPPTTCCLAVVARQSPPTVGCCLSLVVSCLSSSPVAYWSTPVADLSQVAAYPEEKVI